ncbi:TonB-dependent receptor [Dyadobacter fermentans]|uniref:TonB-dependent receptor n=1 Tax=Dyadobacter fermentans TaxID=94254 RepID=UPI0021D409CA|nr:TonB-dependent receptor [Dyadobacter fermentans]MBZ1357412.1 TonB-dependent receptor [Dyadobacter fermentans]
MHSRVILVFLLFIFVLSQNLLAQTEKGTVKGIVKNSFNQPVPSAHVLIKGSGVGAQTDENGSFVVTDLAPGAVVFTVSSLGFAPQEKKVRVGSGEVTTIEFNLEQNTSQLDEIIVSASRRVESLSETPSSVTVISPREIDALSTVSPNIANIVGYAVPGLGSPTNQTGNYGQTLRGRNLLVLIDGIPQSTPLRAGGRDIRSIDPSVIERVEVIKGATAIYGNGADGGLINYITKVPRGGSKIGGLSQVGLTGNTKGDSTIGFRVSQQLFGQLNKFDYVVSGMYEKTGVYRDAEGQVISPEYGLGETKIYNAFTKLAYNFSQNQRLELMYNFYSSNQHSAFVLKNGVFGKSPAIGVLGKRVGIDEGTRHNHNLNLQYTSKEIFGKTSLTANVYLQDFWTVYSNSASFYGSGQSEIVSNKKGLRVNLNTPLRLTDKISGDVTYGFDLLNDKTAQSLVDGRVWVPKIDMRNLAPYAQLSVQWFDHLNLKAGARAENIRIQINDYNTLATGANGAGSIAVKGGTLNYNALVFNAGARYSKFRLFNPFVSYSQSFSIFDLGRVLRAARESTISKLETKPIIVNNYEGGFSSQLGKLNLTAAYYYSTSKLGSNLLEVDGVYIAERMPERVWGYEVQVDYRVLSGLTLGGNYAYVEGKGDKDQDGSFGGEKDIYLNSNRITPAKITAYAKFSHKNLNIDLNWMYVGNRNRFKPNEKGIYALGEAPIESFNLWNLAAAYKITKQLKLSLGVENLLNTAYYPTIAQFYGNDSNYTRGNGRRFNLVLGYAF